MDFTCKLGTREEKRAFYKRAARVTLPIAFENFMDAAVGSVDVIMLSFVSQSALAASSLAGQINMIMSMLLYGISSGGSILAAQYWGKGDRATIERVLGLVCRISMLVGALFTLAAAVFPQLLMRIYTDDPALIAEGIKYLRAVSASFLLNSYCVAYLSIMRSVERVKMSAAVHSSAVFLNVALNACFIFGMGPFPALGITGVALATSISRMIETIICLIDNSRCAVIRLHMKNLFARGGQLMRDFFKFSIPAAANDVIWGLAFSVYSMILGHLSSNIVAANSVASVVRNLGTVVCYGAASSAAIILGKTLGDNRKEEAEIYAKRFVWISVWTAIAGSILILLCRPLVLKFMYLYVTVTDVVRAELGTMLLINSYYIIGASVNTMMICGIFRSGGDVRYGMICDTVSMWGYAVPVGLICAFVLKLPEMWVYFIMCLDEFVKMPFNILHYRKRSWLNNITRDNI